MKSTDEQELEQLPFDQALAQLQQVVRALEGGDLPLDEALKAFERGVKLSRACQKQLSAADQKIDLLIRGGEPGTEPELAPFQGASAPTADENRKNKA